MPLLPLLLAAPLGVTVPAAALRPEAAAPPASNERESAPPAGPSTARSALRLGLRAGSSRSRSRVDHFGVLSLEADLDGLLGAAARGAQLWLAEPPGPAADEKGHAAEAAPWRGPTPGGARFRASVSGRPAPQRSRLPPGAARPVGAPPASSALRARTAPGPMQRVAQRTMAAALRLYDASHSEGELRSLADRARYAAGLPDVRLRGGTSADQSLRLAPTVSDPARYTQDGSKDLWFDAQLTWRLGRAVFSPEEVAVTRLRQARLRDRARIAERVARTLRQWRAAQLTLGDPLASPEQQRRALLDALEASALLDALTEGAFSLELRRGEWARAP